MKKWINMCKNLTNEKGGFIKLSIMKRYKNWKMIDIYRTKEGNIMKKVFIEILILVIAVSFLIPNRTNAASTEKEYRYTQNMDFAPRYSFDASNKDYLLIALRDTVGVKTDSIKIYKFNASAKKYNTEVKTEILKENVKSGSGKKTIVKILRKNISNKNEAVKMKIVAKDMGKNESNLIAYITVTPLEKKTNNKWFEYTNSPRISVPETVEAKTKGGALKKKVELQLKDDKGIKSLKIFDLNSSTPTKAKVTIQGKTSYKLDLSQYTVKKSPNGKDACKLRFIVESKSGRKRNEVIYISAKKYERKAATSLKLSNQKLTMNLSGTKTLKATITPKNTTDKLTYTSSNKNIATVNQNGKITPKKLGSVKITAKIGDLKKECTVTIKNVRSYEYTISITKQLS